MAEDEEPELELDAPWKEALEAFFEDFLSFYFTDIHNRVDWPRGYEFLDQELMQLLPTSETGMGRVDKLAKVWFLDGSEQCVFIHVEVQSQQQANFSERMYTYNHRLRDHYGRMPISMAILGDESVGWRPEEFTEECGGCVLRFRFRTAKLLEWTGRDAELAANTNPFAAVTQAHVKTLETRGRPDSRQDWKRTLVRAMYDRGYEHARIHQLLRVIDWIMKLSHDREAEFWTEHKTFEEDRKMPQLSPLERLWLDQGTERGKLEGKLEAIESILDVRFGSAGVALMPRVRAITDLATLSDLQRFAITAELDAIAARLPAEAS